MVVLRGGEEGGRDVCAGWWQAQRRTGTGQASAVESLRRAASASRTRETTATSPSPLFSRSVPVQWWNYPVLAATAVLAGLVLATFVTPPCGTAPRAPERPVDQGDPAAKTAGRLGSAGGLLSLLAVGCPVCNKLVLVLLGTSGALTYWAPLQPPPRWARPPAPWSVRHRPWRRPTAGTATRPASLPPGARAGRRAWKRLRFAEEMKGHGTRAGLDPQDGGLYQVGCGGWGARPHGRGARAE
ncbi:hypothetical protein ACPCSL_28345 [Streptomyces griseoincarnatus]|uniref:hypothetical protein n=1 Tax=Streptomyces sp. PAM3C TaxID=2847300 RepID=UPI0035ABB6DD